MATVKLEDRVAVLEAEMERLKGKLEEPAKPWWEQIAGTFAGDPLYEEAMGLGRKYRQSLRPKAPKRGRRGKRLV